MELGMVTSTGTGQGSARTGKAGLASAARVLLLVGWAAAAAGCYGVWLDHGAAALSLSGPDLAEFAKFLPGDQAGPLRAARHLFYLPACAVVLSAALTAGSVRLAFGPWPRALTLLGAALVSLQMLPPSWTFSSLTSAEFRGQAAVAAVGWLLLSTYRLLGRLPFFLCSVLVAVCALLAAGLSAWQLARALPAIERLYGAGLCPGWGFSACMVGLAVVALSSGFLAGTQGSTSVQR